MTDMTISRGMRYVAVWIAVAGLSITVGFWALWPTDVVRSFMAESGPVESLNAALFGVAALAVWPLSDRRRPARVWVALSVLMLGAMARELDWHSAFTGKSVLKLSYYLAPGPLVGKLVALAVLVAIAWAAVTLLRHGLKPWWQALRRREAMAITVATLFVVLVGTKVLDRSLNLLRDDLGWQIGPAAYALQSSVEEGLEMLLPLFVLLALWQRRRAAAALTPGRA